MFSQPTDRSPPECCRLKGVRRHSTPCTHTPMGTKGCGEVGTIGSPAAVANAVVDALSHLGVNHVDMPATANRIWRVIKSSSLLEAAE